MCHVLTWRGKKIQPYLVAIMEFTEPPTWPVAPADWTELDVVYRETRIQPPCTVCEAPADFCRVVEIEESLYWADLCGDHMDPGHLIGLP